VSAEAQSREEQGRKPEEKKKLFFLLRVAPSFLVTQVVATLCSSRAFLNSSCASVLFEGKMTSIGNLT